MVLLRVLSSLAGKFGWRLIVAHFNHRLRGRAGDADERFVHAAARRLGLDYVSGAEDVRRLADEEGLSIEMAARRCRHEFLAREAKDNGISRIALAHHADDQVELFFLRLLRGAGSQGLAGMKAVSASPWARGVKLVRPLLECSRADIEAFAVEARVSFREDASNRSPEFLRNRIRRELLPLLRSKFQPAINGVVLRQMEILSAENELLEADVRRWLREKAVPFHRLPVAVQRRVLQRQLEEMPVAPEFERIEFLRRHPGTAVSVSRELSVWCDREGRVRSKRVAPSETSVGGKLVSLAGKAGKGTFGGLSWNWTRVPARNPRLPAFEAGTEWFDAERVGSEVVLRFWRPGDRFQPIGMRGTQKLQDLFTNLKIPRVERGRRMVATTPDGRIWWVEGLRIGEHFKLRPDTRNRLRWTWHRRHSKCGVQ